MTTRILVVDNYDSFVWTIAGYLAQLGAECDVLRNDAVGTEDAAGYDGVLLSPGPGTPAEAGMAAEAGYDEPMLPPVVEQRRVDPEHQLGRNDPCWCGSGKKFKKCHGA